MYCNCIYFSQFQTVCHKLNRPRLTYIKTLMKVSLLSFLKITITSSNTIKVFSDELGNLVLFYL